jgi:molecular chaperone DnaK (HSP70)
MVIAAFDWTVVVTAVTTLVAAGIGYLAGAAAARIQARAQLEQLKWERAEAQRQARQRVYADFLNAANGILTLTEHEEPITGDRFYAWLDDYTKRYNALLLLGVQEVSSFLTTFGPIQRDLFERLRQSSEQLRHADASVDKETTFDRAVREACNESEQQRRDGIHELVNIMRCDVAPDGGAVYDVPADVLALRAALRTSDDGD